MTTFGATCKFARLVWRHFVRRSMYEKCHAFLTPLKAMHAAAAVRHVLILFAYMEPKQSPNAVRQRWMLFSLCASDQLTLRHWRAKSLKLHQQKETARTHVLEPASVATWWQLLSLSSHQHLDMHPLYSNSYPVCRRVRSIDGWKLETCDCKLSMWPGRRRYNTHTCRRRLYSCSSVLIMCREA